MFCHSAAGADAVTTVGVADVAPPACDFAQLKLQVSSAEVVEMIYHKEGTVKAKAGYKLVVVHLKGEGPFPKGFEPASNWFDIEAVYGDPTKGKGEISFGIVSPLGVKIAELMGGQVFWAFSVHQVSRSDGGVPFGMRIDGRQIISQSQDLIRIPNEGGNITVAFQLPVSVKAFTVRVPMALKGAGGNVVQLP